MMNLDSRLESLKSPMTEKPLGCLSRCVLGLFNYSYHWCIGNLWCLFMDCVLCIAGLTSSAV